MKHFLKIITALLLVFSFVSCKTTKDGVSSKETIQKKKELTEKQQVDFTYFFYNGNKEKMLGNYEQAIANFLQCNKIDETNPAPMYELAFIYSLIGKNQLAIPLAKKASEYGPNNVWYQLLYAELLEDNGKYNEAVLVFRNIVKTNPLRLDFYNQLAEACVFAKKYDEAIKTYDMVEEMIGMTEDISLQKIRLYKQTGKGEKAIEEAKKLIQKFPKEAKYYGVLGELYQEKGMKEKALETYTDFLKIEPDNALIHLSLADYYRVNKEDQKAFNEIKIAFKNPDLDIDTKMKILLSYYTITETHKEFKEEANELCKILIDVRSHDAKSYSIYGDFLYRDKKLEESRKQFKKAIELDKSKYALWNQLLIIDSELNDYESMLKESNEAIELFPEQPVAYLLNGIANIQMNKNKEAIAILKKGIGFVAKNDLLLSQFYSNLGDTYNKLKDYKSSDEAYERAIELDPKNVYVLNNYSYYLSLRKENLERAEQMSKKSNEIETTNNSFEDTYGWILYQMGKYSDAKKWLEKSMENGGKNSVIIEHYGDVLYKLGDVEKAYQQWMDAKQKGTGSDLLEKKIADKKLYE